MLYALQPFQLDEAQTQPSDFFFLYNLGTKSICWLKKCVLKEHFNLFHWTCFHWLASSSIPLNWSYCLRQTNSWCQLNLCAQGSGLCLSQPFRLSFNTHKSWGPVLASFSVISKNKRDSQLWKPSSGPTPTSSNGDNKVLREDSSQKHLAGRSSGSRFCGYKDLVVERNPWFRQSPRPTCVYYMWEPGELERRKTTNGRRPPGREEGVKTGKRVLRNHSLW